MRALAVRLLQPIEDACACNKHPAHSTTTELALERVGGSARCLKLVAELVGHAEGQLMRSLAQDTEAWGARADGSVLVGIELVGARHYDDRQRLHPRRACPC